MQNASGRDPAQSGAPAVVAPGALQRSLLAFLPEVSLLHLTVRSELLETFWQGDIPAANYNVCHSTLGALRSEVADYIAYAEQAVDSLVDWRAGADCAAADDDCAAAAAKAAPGQWVSAHHVGDSDYIFTPSALDDAGGGDTVFSSTWACGVAGGDDGPRQLTCQPNGEAGGPDSCVRCAQPGCDAYSDLRDAFHAGCAADKAAYLAAQRAQWDAALLESLRTWRGFANTLQAQGYCKAASRRGRLTAAGTGVRERMGTKSFAALALAGGAPVQPAQWRAQDDPKEDCTPIDCSDPKHPCIVTDDE